MKITFVTNACAIYEQDGFRLLADPWLSESCFEGAWIHDPPITTKPQDLLDVDALYISHLHQDHLDPETLKYFRRDIPIVTLKDRMSLCKMKLEEMGFSNVIALADKEHRAIGPFEVHIFAPFTKHPFHDSDIGNVVDSAMLIESFRPDSNGFLSNDDSVFNFNDNMPDIESARWLGEIYGPIDVAQLNFNNAGPYPACFMNLSHSEKLEAHHASIERNLNHMAAVASAMGAKQVMPFAGAFKLSKKWEHLNDHLGSTTDKSAVAYLKEKGLRAFTLAEGESYIVE